MVPEWAVPAAHLCMNRGSERQVSHASQRSCNTDDSTCSGFRELPARYDDGTGRIPVPPDAYRRCL